MARRAVGTVRRGAAGPCATGTTDTCAYTAQRPRRQPAGRRRLPLQRQPARERAARLFLDRRLTPLERNAWQVFRLHAQRRRRDRVPHLRPAPALSGVHAPARRRPRMNRGAAPDAAAADALAEPGATTRDPKTGRILRQPLRAARRTADTVRGDAARPRLPRPGQPGADPFCQGGADRRHEHARRSPKTRCWPHPPVTRLQVLAERMANQDLMGRRGYPQEDCGSRFRRRRARRPASGMANDHFGIRSRAETRARRLSSESEGGPYCTYLDRINEVRTPLPRRRARCTTCACPSACCELKAEQQAARWWPCSRWTPRCGRRCWTNGPAAATTAVRNPGQGTCSASSRRPSTASSMPGPAKRFRHRHPSRRRSPPPEPAAPARRVPVPPPAPNGLAAHRAARNPRQVATLTARRLDDCQ